MPGKQPRTLTTHTIRGLTPDQWHTVRVRIGCGKVWNPVEVYRIICRVVGQDHMKARINKRLLLNAIRLYARQNTPPLNERTQR